MSAVATRARVLLVEDDAALRRAIGRMLERMGHQVIEAEDGARAIELSAKDHFDVVLTDIMMPGVDGIAVLRAVRERDLDVPVLLMTGAPDLDTAVAAIALGALEYLTKPIGTEALGKSIDRALKLHELARTKRKALALVGSGSGAGDRAGLEASFERALQTLFAAYQPIVWAKDGSLYGYEALMRSREPSLPHPGAVLDAAERLERMTDLGRRMRQVAAEPMVAAGGVYALFVNLHPRDLEDDLLASAESPLQPIAERVVFEVTERSALDEIDDARGRVEALRARGYRIAIDDLGAGYAGLTSFVQLEPHLVKLDMSLVRDVHKAAMKQKLVSSMVTLCHEMGLLVVAEGVETVEERDALIRLGCDLLQGYLFAKPGPPFPEARWP